MAPAEGAQAESYGRADRICPEVLPKQQRLD